MNQLKWKMDDQHSLHFPSSTMQSDTSAPLLFDILQSNIEPCNEDMLQFDSSVVSLDNIP